MNDWTEPQGGAETTSLEKFQAIVAHEGQQVKEEINNMYRIKSNEEDGEYIFYHAILRSKTKYGVKKLEYAISEVGKELMLQRITVSKRRNEDLVRTTHQRKSKDM